MLKLPADGKKETIDLAIFKISLNVGKFSRLKKKLICLTTITNTNEILFTIFHQPSSSGLNKKKVIFVKATTFGVVHCFESVDYFNSCISFNTNSSLFKNIINGETRCLMITCIKITTGVVKNIQE